MGNILITGTGGDNSLGHHIALSLQRNGHTVYGATLYREDRPYHTEYNEMSCDVRNLHSILSYRDSLERENVKIDCLINCAGLHVLAHLEDLSVYDWNDVIDTNARGIFYMTKAFLPHLSRWEEGIVPNSEEGRVGRLSGGSGGAILNILSTAYHVPMTASLAYQASKGAAAIMTRQMARELMRRHDIVVFGVSPNKIDGTEMSQKVDEEVCRVRGWDYEYMKTYSNQNICCGKETDPETLANFIAHLLSSRENHEYLAGCILEYGNQR